MMAAQGHGFTVAQSFKTNVARGVEVVRIDDKTTYTGVQTMSGLWA